MATMTEADARTVRCPKCNAPPGERCHKLGRSREKTRAHELRWGAAFEAMRRAAPTPTPEAPR